jgi:hypothetical protein
MIVACNGKMRSTPTPKDAFAFARDHDAFESLQTLFVLTLFDPHMDANGVARNEIRNITLQLCLINGIKCVHCHSPHQ